MAKINISSFKVNSTQEFFIDTSVWLLLYGNLFNYNKSDQKFYSNFYQEIIQKNAAIILTSMVMSEFANVIINKAFKDFALENKIDINSLNKKKDFVGTDAYKSAVLFITSSLNQILSLSNIVRISDSFTDINFNNIFNNLFQIDFNDSYYLELLNKRNQGTILVTNDGDFNQVQSNILIYTNK